jgi:hypothetical protein
MSILQKSKNEKFKFWNLDFLGIFVRNRGNMLTPLRTLNIFNSQKQIALKLDGKLKKLYTLQIGKISLGSFSNCLWSINLKMIILQKTALNLAGKQENSNFGIQLFLVSVG